MARAHKTLIWERTRQVQRLRYQLRDYFPAALEAYPDLDAPDALELLARAPDPASVPAISGVSPPSITEIPHLSPACRY